MPKRKNPSVEDTEVEVLEKQLEEELDGLLEELDLSNREDPTLLATSIKMQNILDLYDFDNQFDNQNQDMTLGKVTESEEKEAEGSTG